jgi:pimeloyl-ACP methyl ester carboxylesterase
MDREGRRRTRRPTDRGLGDTVESWQFQLDGLADRYRLIAFDNRGAGRTQCPKALFPLRRWRTTRPTSSGRSRCPPPTWRGSREAASSPRSWRSAIPRLSGVSSSRALGRCRTLTCARGVFSSAPSSRLRRASAPSSRGSSYGSTPRGHTTTGPLTRSSRRCSRFLISSQPRTCSASSTRSSITTPLTASGRSPPPLVLAGGRDMTSRPELCRAVAELIPDARFDVMEEEAHQPFQEVPDEWNARVDAFWRELQARG